MAKANQNGNDDGELANLTSALRALPGPLPPAGLEARLLASIPPPVRFGRRKRGGKTVALTGALALAAAIVLLAILVGRGSSRGRVNDAAFPASTTAIFESISFHVEETHPCDVLPPFAD